MSEPTRLGDLLGRPDRLYNIADHAILLPVVTKVVTSEPVGACQISDADGPTAGDAYICTRIREESEVTRTPSCAACLGVGVQQALDNQLAVWVEVPAVVVP